jgi:hypothetical protein
MNRVYRVFRKLRRGILIIFPILLGITQLLPLIEFIRGLVDQA